MKKTICFLAALIITTFTFITVNASQKSDVFVSLKINNPVMSVNGVDKQIDPGR